MADFKLNRIRYNWKGDWAAGTNYIKDDVVRYGSSTFVITETHTSSSSFYNDFGLDPTDLTVTVGRNAGNTADVFYINGVETPTLELRQGRTYIFNQDSATNIAGTENPLHLSTTADGSNTGGGIAYLGNVKYYLNRAEVSSEVYSSVQFGDVGTVRRELRITIDQYTPATLYYYTSETATPNAGNSVATTLTSKLELMMEGSSFSSVWTISTLYNEDDVVVYGGTVYRCRRSHTSAATTLLGLENDIQDWVVLSSSDRWTNNWAAATRYLVNDLVKFGGTIYRCTVAHAANPLFSTDYSNWEIVIQEVDYKIDWVTSTEYKINDIVKYGGSLWRATVLHTSSAFGADAANWEIYLDGLEFDSNWDITTAYQQGDVVRYGGYAYRAVRYNVAVTPPGNTSDWSAIYERFTFAQDWNSESVYNPGSVVRLNGYVYEAIADNTEQSPPNVSYWKVLISGEAWTGLWTTGNEYKLGDLSTYGSHTYRCILAHVGDNGKRPDNDLAGTGTYWTMHVEGDLNNVMAEQGDLLTYQSGAKARLGKGVEDSALRVANNGTSLEWDLFGDTSNVFYVAPNGVNTPNSGTTLNRPFLTVRYACEHIRTNIDTSTNNATVFVKTGIYKEILPISVPQNTAIVGDELRSTVIMPATGYEASNMFYMRNGTGLRNCTLQGLNTTLGDANDFGTKRPISNTAFVSLDPGAGTSDQSVWITNKSPYVQNVSTFGTGCTGLKVDGELHAGGNDSIVANDFTQIISDGIGVWVTGQGRSELVSVFTYYCHIGYLAEAGGKIRGTNGNNSYGTYGSVSEGVALTETPITGKIDNFAQEATVGFITTDGNNILALEYANAGLGYDASTSYTFTGTGFGATTSAANVVNGGIFEIRLTAPDDITTPGGSGYILITSNAQAGTTSTITFSQGDENEEANYLGMRVVLVSGAGAGQYGYITAYNSATKVATLAKESDGTPGWNHWTGVAVVAPDTTTRYQIEPRVTFSSGAAIARVGVASGRLTGFRIINPGSAYGVATPPTVTITDPNSTSAGTWTVRIGNGVLSQPTFSNRGTGFLTAGATLTGIGYQDSYQTGKFITASGLTLEPGPGANLQIAGNATVYRLVSVSDVTGVAPNISAKIRITPALETWNAPEDDVTITIRENYSQVRLTGHDFLDIGLGNIGDTNYPNNVGAVISPENEIFEVGGGRVFYTSTDQDGNFRVGELFKVEQATGIVTLDADSFSLQGLEELRLGGVILGGTGAVVREFSTDATFSANSNNIVPTQRAIATFIQSRIGGGGADVNVNEITMGQITISGSTMTASVPTISFETKANFKDGTLDEMIIATAMASKR
jgi:hypothetical protein